MESYIFDASSKSTLKRLNNLMTSPSNKNLPSLNEIDRLIHEPARLLIMANLYVLEAADFLYLMNQTGLTFGNLS